jgi:hypothetical protein
MPPEGWVTPESIGIDFIPTRVPGLAEAVVGSEMLVGLGPAQPCHLLNASAALVWQRFDGERDLASIAADLADAYGEPGEVIGADVIALTQQLGGLGLLERVAPAPPNPADAPGLPAAGDEIPHFELADLKGCLRSWASFRGAAVLLINWRPDCGYCLQIAEELGLYKDALGRQGIDLVFVTSGHTDANRSLLERAGLQDVAVLIRQEPDATDPFAGLGTPAAWFCGADGRIAAPLAHGAADVLDLAVRLGGRAPAPDGNPRVRYLPGSGGVCAPGGPSSPASLPGIAWLGTGVYRFGDFHVGVRYNSPETEATLDRLFSSRRIHDPKTPDNYSVAVHRSPVKNGARDLNLLIRSDLRVVRTRSASRVWRALLGYLSMEVYQPNPGLMQVEGLAVVREGQGYLLPSFLYRTYDVVPSRLSRLGLQIADRPWVCLDPSMAEIVIDEPRIPYDPGVLAEMHHGFPTGSELPAVDPGRYPLDRWVFAAEGPSGLLSAASSAARAVGLVTSAASLQTVLDEVVGLFGRTQGFAVAHEAPTAFLNELPVALGWSS